MFVIIARVVWVVEAIATCVHTRYHTSGRNTRKQGVWIFKTTRRAGIWPAGVTNHTIDGLALILQLTTEGHPVLISLWYLQKPFLCSVCMISIISHRNWFDTLKSCYYGNGWTNRNSRTHVNAMFRTYLPNRHWDYII